MIASRPAVAGPPVTGSGRCCRFSPPARRTTSGRARTCCRPANCTWSRSARHAPA